MGGWGGGEGGRVESGVLACSERMRGDGAARCACMAGAVVGEVRVIRRRASAMGVARPGRASARIKEAGLPVPCQTMAAQAPSSSPKT
mgnify:CR=1 FL=1